LASVAVRVRGLLVRRELLSVFVMIFIADLVVGVFSPTFALFASGLGASATLIGLLSSTVGMTRIVASIPIGMISDSKGRKGVLVVGMLTLALSSYLYSLATKPAMLFPMRIMSGIVITSTFFIGMAYAGDRVQREDRGLVSGIYTTCMGLGFTVGSALGGKMAAQFGYVLTFRTAALIALLGVAIAWLGLAGPTARSKERPRAVSPITKLGLLAREPSLFAASVGYLLIILTFDAVLVNIFPLYANSLMIGQAAIGSMFAVRALASTSVRLPTGLLMARIPSRKLMVAALTLGMVMISSIAFLSNPVLLTIALAGEGICFGMYLTAGQAYITEQFPEEDRGTAMGVYSMTGSISSMIGPFAFGAIADAWGLNIVFVLTGIIVFLGIVVILIASAREQRVARRAREA
jgi:MFS family permease